MKSLSVFLKDIGASLKKPKVFIPILVVLFIPVLYSGMFLTAFWDPYGKMNELPVAVVNQDQGAEFESKSLHVGDDLVTELKKSDDFDWTFVTRQEAEQGMKDNKYYMTIVIPEDFSSKATTLMDDQPEPARLIFEPNEGYNFLAAQIGGTAIKQIKTEVSAKVTEAYTETLFGQVEKISSGLGEAGSGAGDLNDGASKLDAGVAKMKENLAKLTKGTGKLASGLAPLEQGTGTLNAGVQQFHQGATKLSSGLDQLSVIGKKLKTGALAVEQGGVKLGVGLNSSLQGTKKLQAGIQASEQGSAKLTAGLEQTYAGSSKVTEGAKGVAQGLEQLVKASPELAQSPAVQKLLAASQAVAEGSEQVTKSQQQLIQGSKQLQGVQGQLLSGSKQVVAGNQQLVQGVDQMQTGHKQLSQGLQQFTAKLDEAAAGGKKLAVGSQALASGTERLQGGLNQFSGGVKTLDSNVGRLGQGAGQLQNGMNKIAAGTGELATKLNEAAEKASSVKATDNLISMYAQPIKIEENKINEVPNYGTGFSPYFLSLGLFVGALITTLVIPMRGSAVEDASGWNRFVSRTLSFTIMGLIQSVLAVLLVLYGLGLEVKSVPMFYLFTFITSLCFMFIIQAIVTWLDQPGRFVAILLLIFQLTTSAGTFPLELIPGWMKAFNPWLPMTYSVTGYKAVISSGDFHVAWTQIGALAIFAVIFLALTCVYFLSHSRGENLEQNEAVMA
ncbi:hypothetical protein DCC85_04810 [Paenibacillus sp. CAA11]|uniref:YhgE/Pip domain-containing protein n=1 Tax=Paenibacillus sp. CAA11 TaxID=1532905 RepID=UPI000D33D3FA|nr:YhgE/Pip domain-containing protein [Paenibacillus sp. CAA11]AWB43611.1 hypothetical protein DCC85_04810 [Paenibacillus sp. CAA11]